MRIDEFLKLKRLISVKRRIPTWRQIREVQSIKANPYPEISTGISPAAVIHPNTGLGGQLLWTGIPALVDWDTSLWETRPRDLTPGPRKLAEDNTKRVGWTRWAAKMAQ